MIYSNNFRAGYREILLCFEAQFPNNAWHGFLHWYSIIPEID